MAGKAQGIKNLRKAIMMIVLALALVIFADGLKTVIRAESATTNNAVNMRKTPSKNGELVKKLEKGTTVELGNLVDGKDGDGKKWYEVTVGGSNGYIRSDLVTKGGGGGASEGNATPTGEIEAVTPVGATISGSNTVRVRTSASTTTSNNILCTVNKGAEVTVVGKTIGSDKKTWYQVKLQVEGKDVIGYVRSDYLAITGEIKPLEADPVPTDPVVNDPEPQITPVENPSDTEPKKRYETKMINDEWWILDYDKSEQYKIDQLFSAAEEYKNRYVAAEKKAKSGKGWIAFLIILVLALCAAVAYLIYRLRDMKEAAFIASIENSTPRRTAERPRGERPAQGQPTGREKPAIKDGLESREREEGQRPANGQRSTGNRPQGQRPTQGQPGQRPAQGQPGQRPVQGQPGQRPAQGQPGQRPAQGQPGQRPAQGQPGQRPAQGQPGQRPAQGQPTQRPAQGERPAEAPAQARPAAPSPAQATPARPKNFAGDSDDMEFEFLNWDSDE